MTLPKDSSLMQMDDPLAENALTLEQKASLAARVERARRLSVAAFSSSPLHQARAAKDPEYWNKFSSGHVNWPNEAS